MPPLFGPPPSAPPPSGPLTVLIVGAGIGGLSAAIALRRAGHNVELFEQSKFANEVGAAIHVGPNASRVLESYGYSQDRLGGVLCQWAEIMNSDGEVIFPKDQSSVPNVYGSPYYLCHRVDLHNELKHLALDPEASPGPVCKLHLSHTVIGIDPEKGLLKFRGPWGPVVAHGDLIIGADGIHSITRTTLFPASSPALPTGNSAFRFLIPTDKLLADPDLARFAPEPGNSGMSIITNSEKRIVMYPCRRGELLNIVCIHPDTIRPTPSSDDWNSGSTVATLTAVYADFDPVVIRLLTLAEDSTVGLWQLKDRGPLESWCSGNVCLLGDAAHPMLPHTGQGGGQAIEDGAALGVLFPMGTAPQEVKGRLKVYEHVRKARTETIQEFARNAAPGAKYSVTLAQISAFTYGHDVVAYAKGSMTAIWVPPPKEPERMLYMPPGAPLSRGPSPGPGGH